MGDLILSKEEVRELTGKQKSCAQAKALNHMGVDHLRTPDGTVVIFRATVNRRFGIDPNARTRPPPVMGPVR